MSMVIAMLQARHSRTHHAPEETPEAITKENVAVVPLAIPLIAGSGAISTIIINAHQAISWLDMAMLVVISLIVALSVWRLAAGGPCQERVG